LRASAPACIWPSRPRGAGRSGGEDGPAGCASPAWARHGVLRVSRS
jgi:hypothetical protein